MTVKFVRLDGKSCIDRDFWSINYGCDIQFDYFHYLGCNRVKMMIFRLMHPLCPAI